MKRNLLITVLATSASLSAFALLDDDAACKAAREAFAKMTTDEKAQLTDDPDPAKVPTSPQLSESANLPSLSALAQTWDVAWALRHGEVLGAALRDRGVETFSGPSVNLLRTPTDAEAWDHLGEDPCLAAKLCVPMIQGVQSYDVAATVGTLCAGKLMPRDVRMLNECDLHAFRAAVKEGQALRVRAGNDAYLERGILRDRWGFKGVLVSNRLASEDEAALRTLYVRAKTGRLAGGGSKKEAYNAQELRIISRCEGSDSIVLLKNEQGVLPLRREALRHVLALALCEDLAPVAALSNRLAGATIKFLPLEATIEPIKSAAEEADAVLIFVGPELARRDEQQRALNVILGCKLRNAVVISRSGAPVAYTWMDRAQTLVQTSALGLAEGDAIADVLLGEVSPSGRLCWSWPKTPSVVRHERFHVGYRWHDHAKIEPLFPFGFGRSYTTFAWTGARIRPGRGPYQRDAFEVSVDVTNTGKVAGRDVVQVYLAYPHPTVERCAKDLRGFAKTRLLKPGETETLSIVLTARDFAYWDVLENRFRADQGEYEVLLAASAAEIRERAKVRLTHDQHFRD